jgi:hypothetical protein
MPAPSHLVGHSLFNAPLACIFHRLMRDHAAGKRLHGMVLKSATPRRGEVTPLWFPGLLEEIEDGALPCVRYRGTATREQRTALRGALNSGQDRKDQAVEALRSIQISVLTSVSRGALNHTPGRTQAPLGHEDWVMRVFDCIETTDAGQGDSMLDGACSRPISISASPPEMDSEHYYETVLTVECVTFPYFRGDRGCTLQ